MVTKYHFLLLVMFHAHTIMARGLRNKPKIYNVIITSDENLRSSRAYPVIQPTIHESGVSFTHFGTNHPFNLLSPASTNRFGKPIVPGLQINRQKVAKYPLPILSNNGSSDAASENQEAQSSPEYQALNNSDNSEMLTEKLPITLNEYGLPPLLMSQPLKYNYNLPSYGFNEYPVILYSARGNQDYLLPEIERNMVKTKVQANYLKDESVSQFERPFEDIKNGAEYRNKNVPDVPPPPIPIGIRRSFFS